jgi:peroxin-6
MLGSSGRGGLLLTLSLSGLIFIRQQVAELSVPPKWLQTFSHIFSHATSHQDSPENTLNVLRVQPVLITNVIVTALSYDAYVAASSQVTSIATWLSDDSLILRQGAVHTFGSDLLPTNGHGYSGFRKIYQYRLDMLEPVLQGFAQKGSTRFFVTSTNTWGEQASPEDELELESTYDSGSDPDAVEIDEIFFANSVLHSRQNPVPPDPLGAVTDGLQYSNGEPEESTTFHPDRRFRTEPLPEPQSIFQDDCALYLRTSDLGRIGVLNGGWVGFQFVGLARGSLFCLRRLLLTQARHQIIDLFEYLLATT